MNRLGGTDSTSPQTVRFYDEEAPGYEKSRYASPAGRRVDRFHKRVLEATLFDRLERGAAILELGCGTGRLLRHFADRAPGLRGIDASLGMLGQAGRQGAGRVLQGSAYALPFPDATFDGAYAILVLNLLSDYTRALAEVARVLKPGARFVFNVPNLHSMYWPGGVYVNLRRRTVGSNRAGSRYSHWFSRREVNSACSSATLKILELLGQSPRVSAGWSEFPVPENSLEMLACKSLYVVTQKA